MHIVKVGGAVYRELRRVQRRMMDERGKPVSMEDVLWHLLESSNLKLGDFAGAWKMSNDEFERIMKGLTRFWAGWRIRRDLLRAVPNGG